MNFKEAKGIDVSLLVDVAHEVWEPTYRHIIPPDQIKLMMQDMHTLEAYLSQISSGHRFFLAMDDDGQPLGFISFHPQVAGEQTVMRIPKLYVKTLAQGKGVGSTLLDKVEEEARHRGIHFLELNVNRYNKALYFYRRNGFYIQRSEDIPYKGFWLNDYVLRRRVVG